MCKENRLLSAKFWRIKVTIRFVISLDMKEVLLTISPPHCFIMRQEATEETMHGVVADADCHDDRI